MSNSKPLRRLLSFFGVALATVIAARADSYLYQTVYVSGAPASLAQGINSAGQIVGTVGPSGYILTGDTVTLVNYPAAQQTQPNGINASGQVVGDVDFDPGFAFVGSVNGGFQGLTFPGADLTFANGINDQGAVAGQYQAYGTMHGFIWTNGAFSSLSLGDGSHTAAWGINNSGQIVGTYAYNGGVFAFLKTGNSVEKIEVPGTITFGTAVNNTGAVGGWFSDPITFSNRGFVYANGSFQYLDFPGATDTTVFGINDLGEVVGNYFIGDSEFGFMATPVPEPVYALLAGAILLGFGTWRRFRR